MENFTEVYKNKYKDKYSCHSQKIRTYKNVIILKNDEQILESLCQFCNTEDDVYKYRKKHFSNLLDDFHVKYNIEYNNVKVFKSKRKNKDKHEWKLNYNNIDCLKEWGEYYLQNVEYIFLCKGCNKKRNQDYEYKVCLPLDVDKNGMLIYNEDKTDRRKSKKIIMSVLRNLINHDTRKFRESRDEQICEECLSYNNIHVDHYLISFMEILNNFLENNNVSFFEIDSLANVHTFKKTIEYKTKNIEKDWIDYHNEKATYRLLCRSCNSKFRTYGFKDKLCKVKILKEVTIHSTESSAKTNINHRVDFHESCAEIISFRKSNKSREINIF
jgi:hypothetical protein